jgi:hypothetical protein
MKYFRTFESFLVENFEELDLSWVWQTIEQAELSAYMKRKGIKNSDEAETQWNNDLDDPKSELSIAIDNREDPYYAAQDIDVKNPSSVRNFIKKVEKDYSSKKTLLSETVKTREFMELKKALTIYADKLERYNFKKDLLD